MKHIVLIACFLGLVACGSTRKAQDQAAADALPGVDALAALAADQEKAAEIRLGLRDNIAAAANTGLSSLPEPNQTSSEILARPDAFVAQAQENRKAVEEAGNMWLWFGGAGISILGFLKFVPGAHQPLVSMLSTVLANRKDRAMAQKTKHVDDYARSAMRMLSVARLASPAIEDLAERVEAGMPPEMIKAVREYAVHDDPVNDGVPFDAPDHETGALTPKEPT